MTRRCPAKLKSLHTGVGSLVCEEGGGRQGTATHIIIKYVYYKHASPEANNSFSARSSEKKIRDLLYAVNFDHSKIYNIIDIMVNH